MDASTLTLLIISVILATAGIAALIAAYRVRVRTLTDTIDQQTQLAVRNSQIDDIQHNLEMTQLQLETTHTELDHYKDGTAKIAGSLIALGVIHPDTDILALTKDDIILPKPEIIIEPEPAPVLPVVPGVTAQDVRKALVHAANRTGSRASRPFSRQYMIDSGPCTRPQLDDLVNVLLDNGYLVKDSDTNTSPALTPLGQSLLDLVRTGKA